MTAMPCGQKNNSSDTIHSQTVTPPLAAIDGTTFRLKMATTNNRTKSARPRTRLRCGWSGSFADNTCSLGFGLRSAAVPAAVVGASRPDCEGRMPSRQPARCRRYKNLNARLPLPLQHVPAAPWPGPGPHLQTQTDVYRCQLRCAE